MKPVKSAFLSASLFGECGDPRSKVIIGKLCSAYEYVSPIYVTHYFRQSCFVVSLKISFRGTAGLCGISWICQGFVRVVVLVVEKV